LEFAKVSRNQIKRYVERRYTSQMTEKIMKAFGFPHNHDLSFDEYCGLIESFVARSLYD
jgi:hypothetical protein